MNDLIEALNSDGWKDFDMSSRSLEEWIAIAQHIQNSSMLTLSRVERILIPGRIAHNLQRAGVCTFDDFNQKLVARGGLDLWVNWFSVFDCILPC